MTKRLVIIDGKSVFYRGYYAMPNLSTADGTPTGGVYGFAALSLELIKKLKPDYVHVLINGKIVKTGDASLVREIEEKGYDTELLLLGIPKEKIRHYGFAFEGKKVLIG